MIRKLGALATVSVVLLVVAHCDKGLTPPEDQGITGISGTIFFSNWPPPDSLFDLRLVAFKNFPPENILVEILNGNAYVFPSIETDSAVVRKMLPFYADQVDYLFELPPGTYGYLAVAHQYGPNLLTDWQAVGQYDTDADSLPSPVVVREGEILRLIPITVDFHNLPIQPF